MAYYAAVISLKHTINRLLNSPHFSILPPYRIALDFAFLRAGFLEKVLEILDSSKNRVMVDSLREQIRDAVYKLEDAIEFHASDQFLSQSERLGNEGSNLPIFSLGWDEVLKQELNYLRDMARRMEDECNNPDLKLRISLPEEDEADSLRNDFDGIESEMVGLSDVFNQIKDSLLLSYGYGTDGRRRSFVIGGMAGIGKTTLAKKIYQDPEICNYFDCRLWVTVGPECESRNIMLRILTQLNHDIHNIQMKEVEELGNYLYTTLKSRRYLIVLDDVWNGEMRDLERYFPHENNSQALLTSRIRPGFGRTIIWNVRFLNEGESWCLLQKKVFGEESCPPQLEKAGKKIAKNCDGLPLLIVAVAHLLSKAEKTLEYWNKVAEKKDKSIFVEANDKISNILLRSYRYLPQDLRACFLYMGAFPAKSELPASKLINVWTAEDLFDSDDKSPKRLAFKYVSGLASNNVVLAHQSPFRGVKTCSLHSSFWHACVRQSWKERFLHVISSLADSFKEGARIQRRLCISNNALFGMKEVYNSVQSISSARSLICSGPYHQYPVPICFDLRLLKVLDVLSVRFYKFPIEVIKLIHLRYLALTYGGKVPAFISKLWNLEYLIVHRHLYIKVPGDWSYLPVEIWNLQKLRHLQVVGSCLPYLRDAFLPHLLKLSDMSAHNCRKEILKRIPNVQKLGIQIEITPDADEHLSCFDHLSCLNELRSLKCFIVNPNPTKPQVVAPPACITTFPSNLKKLSLSGFGYPWEYMSMISKLPKLEVLKLRSYAFRGPEWVVYDDDFPNLNDLLLEDMDLVYLRFHGHNRRSLCKLIIRHCYKLKEIPLDWLNEPDIEIVDSPLVANYTREVGNFSPVDVHSSWDEEEQKA
ncbi:Apoptotic ATPase [Handroanthus impetiginosus]|uniref:Apoptotic ATPase n=1 Tax=Handroanthus impetiginosus TaxID=429701 RepID=A0A2G9HCH5_9LAMI|nr:Apoptotic ATPase [Handroanthus impetiginosus]